MQNLIKLTSLIMVVVAMLFLSAGCFAEKNASTSTSEAVADANRFPDFTTVDIEGNSVTQDIFKDKKVTVINIWGTFCPPCIGEMPELGQWAREMPADAQIIGLVCDVSDKNDKKTINKAQKITAEANVKFVNIIPNSDIMKYLEQVEAVPTTIFVNSKGEIIGEMVVGANVPKYKELLKRYLK